MIPLMRFEPRETTLVLCGGPPFSGYQRTMASVIFVTLKNGPYADRWSSELLPVMISEHRAGVRELTWEGQRTNPLDDVVRAGTWVAVRDKPATAFRVVGRVCMKQCTREWRTGHPAEYKLLVEMETEPKEYLRDAGERLYHNPVLRALGLPIERGTVAFGIYG